MGRPTTLTREWLETHHIVEVTRDGKVFALSKQKEIYEINPVKTSKQTRYGCKEYFLTPLYDKETYKEQKANNNKYVNGLKFIPTHRIVYAWWNKEAPSGMDVDHKNDDSLDNRLENLQLLTRAENLAKRKGHMNQYEKSIRN